MKKVALSLVALAAALSAAAAQEPIWDGNTVELEAQRLADGVFAVIPAGADAMAKAGRPIATTAGFVIGTESVLIVDTMLNERLNAQLLALVRKETALPIRYAVNTSYHGDHSYGNQYLPASTLIVQHVNASRYIANKLEDDKAFMIDNFGKGRGIEAIEHTAADLLVDRNGAIRIDLGGMEVSIRDYGFAQTGGDLFVFVPSANVLWTGNPVIARAPALPWLLDGHLIETRDTLRAVRDAVDSGTRVVPGHGPVTTIETLDWNIAYLNAVAREVTEAIADGLTLDETVARVTLPDFQGYALYGWVHPQLNVPAAYNDLK